MEKIVGTRLRHMLQVRLHLATQTTTNVLLLPACLASVTPLILSAVLHRLEMLMFAHDAYNYFLSHQLGRGGRRHLLVIALAPCYQPLSLTPLHFRNFLSWSLVHATQHPPAPATGAQSPMTNFIIYAPSSDMRIISF